MLVARAFYLSIYLTYYIHLFFVLPSLLLQSFSLAFIHLFIQCFGVMTTIKILYVQYIKICVISFRIFSTIFCCCWFIDIEVSVLHDLCSMLLFLPTRIYLFLCLTLPSESNRFPLGIFSAHAQTHTQTHCQCQIRINIFDLLYYVFVYAVINSILYI